MRPEHTMETATRSRREQAATRREQILEAALQVFAEKGYEGASIRDISRKVGVTEGLIYHYFDGKAHLMYSCWSERAWQANLERILADAENIPLSQALESLVVELLNTLREQADIVRLWMNEMQHDE